MRKDEELRMSNRGVRSKISTQAKKVLAAVEAKDGDKAQAELKLAVKLMDQAVGNHVYHRNTVARKKSHITKAVNAMLAASN